MKYKINDKVEVLYGPWGMRTGVIIDYTMANTTVGWMSRYVPIVLYQVYLDGPNDEVASIEESFLCPYIDPIDLADKKLSLSSAAANKARNYFTACFAPLTELILSAWVRAINFFK